MTLKFVCHTGLLVYRIVLYTHEKTLLLSVLRQMAKKKLDSHIIY